MNQDFINIFLPKNIESRKTYEYNFSEFSDVRAGMHWYKHSLVEVRWLWLKIDPKAYWV